MVYGYARLSSRDRKPDPQIAALKSAGCGKIFEDRITRATARRPQLVRCLHQLKQGDTLIVLKLDRLSRTLGGLVDLLDDVRARGIKFRSLSERIDTDTVEGRAMWQMIGFLADVERSLNGERVALSHPRRRPKLTPQQVSRARTMMKQGEVAAAVAARLHVSRATLYRALAR
jgi:DNA invertase Pin-like site-specific DNA recombinase